MPFAIEVTVLLDGTVAAITTTPGEAIPRHVRPCVVAALAALLSVGFAVLGLSSLLTLPILEPGCETGPRAPSCGLSFDRSTFHEYWTSDVDRPVLMLPAVHWQFGQRWSFSDGWASP